ncbi:MAG: S9 family peptidase [candidate division WOR-3 bacterium]|nr:MAG: S9 family peptidase [candidate division WOR-3 bacterium]
MRGSKFSLILCIVTTCGMSAATFAQTQPVAPVRTVIDDYHGVEISDPYRYMENLKDPEVQQWIKAQADYTQSILEQIPGRDELCKRIEELEASIPAQVRRVYRLANGKVFYLKCLSGEQVYKLYMRDGLDGKEIVLVDPETFRKKTGKPHGINFFKPSWDGKYVAYGISQSGTEKALLYVIDTETGRHIGKPIDRVDLGVTAWLPDGRSFLYNRLQKLTPDMPVTAYYLKNRTYWHKLGTDAEDDMAVFGYGAVRSVDIDELAESYVYAWPNSPYLFAVVYNGDQKEIRIYTSPLVSLGTATIQWTSICEMVDEVVDFEVHGDDIYLLTHENAPRFKVIKTSITNPDMAQAETVLPESEAVLQGIYAAHDALYVQMIDDGIGKILRIPYGDKEKPGLIPLPFAGSIYTSKSDPRIEGILFETTSWTDYGGFYMYDPKTDETLNTGLQPKGMYDSPEDLVAEEVKVTSHDGTLVPLSIIYKKGITLDGSNPTLLMGYGAYGFSSKSFYEHRLYAWYERGGIYAVAHVRGGGEYGDAWHKAGQKSTKPNTWKDFIACAEYLIRKKYTSPDKLAGLGTSAGGITVGRAFTERPDLFAVAVPRVGDLNSLRSETSANGPPNIPEFGAVTTEEGFKALYAMDSYQHVTDGVHYPAVLLTQGINDPRVDPWHSTKMAARLQRATASGKPVLLRIEYEAGHGYGSTKSQLLNEWADIYAFMLWQFGVPEFQLQQE